MLGSLLAGSLAVPPPTERPQVLASSSSSSPSSSSPLPSSPSCPAHRHVACVGDSITFGFLASETSKSYPSQLSEMLGDRFTVENYGVNCAAMLRDGDGDYRKTHAFKHVLASNATDVVVMLGHNDGTWRNWGLGASPSGPHGSSESLSLLADMPGLADDDACKAAYDNATMRWQQWRGGRNQLPISEGSEATETFIKDYADLLASFRAMPSQPNVYLVMPPPLYTDGAYTMNKTLINNVLPSALRRIASTALALQPIDVYDHFAQHCNPTTQYWCDWTIDGCHPNDGGYGQLASKVAESLYATCPEGRPQQVSLSGAPVGAAAAVAAAAAEVPPPHTGGYPPPGFDSRSNVASR